MAEWLKMSDGKPKLLTFLLFFWLFIIIAGHLFGQYLIDTELDDLAEAQDMNGLKLLSTGLFTNGINSEIGIFSGIFIIMNILLFYVVLMSILHG